MSCLWCCSFCLGSPTYSAKSWTISSTSWAWDAPWEAEDWDKDTWSMACVWGLVGEFCSVMYCNVIQDRNLLLSWEQVYSVLSFEHAIDQSLYDWLKIFPALPCLPASVLRTNERVTSPLGKEYHKFSWSGHIYIYKYIRYFLLVLL